MSYGDRNILITVPFPDTVVLVTDVMNQHLSSPFEAGAGTELWIYGQIDEQLTEWVEGFKTGQSVFHPTPSVSLGARRKAVFKLSYDPGQPLFAAYLTLTRTPAYGEIGSWSVKLEFSASKAGPTGLAKLTSLMSDATFLNVDKLLGTMRVRRIDAAIDLIGAEPLDVIAHIKKPGKRLVYVGDHGRPESVYLYEKKPPLKQPPQKLAKRTVGPLRLKLYERQSYFEQLKLDPPYGPCPITRAETESEWDSKKQQPKLADLADLKNQFSGRSVSYAGGCLGQGSSNQRSAWVQFCLAAFGAGVIKSQAKSPLAQGLRFRKLYENAAGDLIADTAWSRWGDGLALTGLSDWVQRAKANAPVT